MNLFARIASSVAAATARASLLLLSVSLARFRVWVVSPAAASPTPPAVVTRLRGSGLLPLSHAEARVRASGGDGCRGSRAMMAVEG